MEQREIKFRARYDDMGGGWKYGMLIYEGMVPRIQIKGTMTFATCLKGTESQFTGLKDKNGVEIYEGDIIVDLIETDWGEQKKKDIVEFNAGAFYPICMQPSDTYEVIGNIYETPELLSKETKTP